MRSVRAGATRFVLDPVLERYAYRCWPNGCPRDRTCCVGLTVEVSRREVRAIDTLMDELAELVPSLREADGYANVFVDEEPPDLLIEADDDGACPFLFRTRKHALCSIHHVALQTGRPVPAYKPAACRHWPLTLVRDRDGVRVTLQPHALKIGCVAPREELPGQPTVAEAYRDEIAELRALVSSPGRTRQAPGRERSARAAEGERAAARPNGKRTVRAVERRARGARG
ncbi:MAG TPA: hypothetical protein VIS07_12035 [Candidatus Binatia bacterium]